MRDRDLLAQENKIDAVYACSPEHCFVYEIAGTVSSRSCQASMSLMEELGRQMCGQAEEQPYHVIRAMNPESSLRRRVLREN